MNADGVTCLEPPEQALTRPLTNIERPYADIGNDVARWNQVTASRPPVMTPSEAAVEANERWEKANCPS